MTIKIGTRKSRLALAQTEMLIKTLKNRFPNVKIETVYISTTGDKTLDKPLAALGGKGVFIKELEMSLLSGETNVAVHSAKDLPTKIADGLEISAVLPRGSYGDVFVTRNNFETKDGFVIGTGSLRRKLFAEKIYPNAKFKDIRGNVDTRLKKLLNGEYDALVLAKAGLERLDLCNDEDYTVTPFDTDEFLPAPCQGIVAIESRKNSEVSKMLAEISDKNTMLSFATLLYPPAGHRLHPGAVRLPRCAGCGRLHRYRRRCRRYHPCGCHRRPAGQGCVQWRGRSTCCRGSLSTFQSAFETKLQAHKVK